MTAINQDIYYAVWQHRIGRRATDSTRVARVGESGGGGSVGKDLKEGKQLATQVLRALQAEETAMPKSPGKSAKEQQGSQCDLNCWVRGAELTDILGRL